MSGPMPNQKSDVLSDQNASNIRKELTQNMQQNSENVLTVAQVTGKYFKLRRHYEARSTIFCTNSALY